MWYGRLDAVIAQLKALPYPLVDRATLEQLLGVGRRRAQQILQPCVTHTVGASSLADRDRLIEHLKRVATSDAAFFEQRRHQRVIREIAKLRQAWLEHPQVMVEAPTQIMSQTFAGLAGVKVSPGCIIVEFDSPQAALERLLALSMAIGNDFQTFERMAGDY